MLRKGGLLYSERPADLLRKPGLFTPKYAHAVGRSKGTYACAFYHRIAGRRGNERAAVATGHYLGKCIYRVLKGGKPYEDLGADYFKGRNTDALKKQLLRRLERLGYQVELTPQTTAMN